MIEDTHNIVAVIIEDKKLDLQSAVDYAGDLCKNCIARFDEARSQLPSWGPEIDLEVKRYGQGLQDWIVGSLHWSFVSKRYFGLEGEAVKNHRTIAITPATK